MVVKTDSYIIDEHKKNKDPIRRAERMKSMTQEVTAFNFETYEVRTVVIDNEPWFVGKDVADALGYSNTRDALSKHVDGEDKLMSQIATSGQNRDMTLVNESGMYSLIFGSKKDEAKKFKKWVTSEVLPSIRKTGSYSVTQVQDSYAIQDPVERAKRWIEEQEEKQALEQALEIQAPKVDYYEKVISSDETLSVTQIASDYGMSAIKLNKLLHNLVLNTKVNGQWVLYSGLSNKGYTESTVGTNDYGTYTTTKWTQKGKEFLYNTLKEHDIYTMDDTVELAKEQGLATMF